VEGGCIGWEGKGRGLVYGRWVLKNSIENSIGGYCMVVIEVVVRSSFYMNMEAFHCIEMKVLLCHCSI
jgi:hypothetical protein